MSPRPPDMLLREDSTHWRRAALADGASIIRLVPLASAPGTTMILAEFPAGLSLSIDGGYAAAEEFLVVRGDIRFSGETFTAGTLAYLPAGLVRRRLHSPRGCRVLAWFSSPPQWLVAPDPELAPTAEPIIAPGSLLDRLEPLQFETTLASWRFGLGPAPGDAGGEAIAISLETWHHAFGRDLDEDRFVRRIGRPTVHR